MPELESFPWIHVREVSAKKFLPFATDLGPGEREAIALALETKDSLLLMDDALARRHALHLGVQVTGTLGVLIKAKRSGHVKQVHPILERLESLGFRLDPVTRAAVLKLAGEPER